jgi:hypothetical protein
MDILLSKLAKILVLPTEIIFLVKAVDCCGELSFLLTCMLRFVNGRGLCCTNPVRASSRDSRVVAGMHEQTHTPNLQDQKLASLQ